MSSNTARGLAGVLARAPRMALVPALAATLLIGGLATAPPAGARGSRIVGGRAAVGREWPWLARIQVATANADYYCSGTVVSPTVVLTAGHCVIDAATGTPWPRSGYTVTTRGTAARGMAARGTAVRGVAVRGVAARGKAARGTGSGGWQSSAVSEVDLYPAYLTVGAPGEGLPDHDLALLRLATPTRAPAVKLADPAADAALYEGGTDAQVAGFGETSGGADSLPSTARVASTVVQSQSFCGGQASASFGVGYDSGSEICAMDTSTDSQGACNGDSGGPLVATEPDGTAVEIGIMSWLASGCSTSLPDFFTDVASFSGWLAPEVARLSSSSFGANDASRSRHLGSIA